MPDKEPSVPTTPVDSVLSHKSEGASSLRNNSANGIRPSGSFGVTNALPKHTRRALDCILTILENPGCYFVGQVVEALWDSESNVWMAAEILNVEQSSSGTCYYYVHFLEKSKKDDDWLGARAVRPVSDLGTLACLRSFESSDPLPEGPSSQFFQLSQLTKQTTAGSSAYGSRSSADPHEYSPKTVRGINFEGTPIRAWYRSPFPRNLWSFDAYLPMCSCCLEFADTIHSACSSNFLSGGLEVYSTSELVIFQVDGAESPSYCERLFLLAKLFLEDKRTSADESQTNQVMSFLFYVLMEKTRNPQKPFRFVGYFSKYKQQKKDSPILSCILVLPSEQRKGYGKLLISTAYEIAKREGRPPGSAERPLSGPGYFAFQSWWAWRMRSVMETCYDGEVLTIAQLGELAGMTSEDVVDTLRSCGALKQWGSGEVKLRESGKRAKIQLTMAIFNALEAKAPRNRVSPNAFDPEKLNNNVRLCAVLQTPKN